MLSKKGLLKTTGHFAFLLGFLFLILQFPTPAKSQPGKLESQVKKIVMMMNIVNKEYEAGIAEGQIINAAEYEESLVFIEQALNRYQKLIKSANPQEQG